MTILALSESAKLLPYIIGSRKAVKVYLKVGGPLAKHTNHLLLIMYRLASVYGPRRRIMCE